jgi:hypothetical protein
MEDERIEIGWFSQKQLHELVATRKINDAKTLVGYFFWREHKMGKKAKLTRSLAAAP